jgi:hypothetical protein
VSLYGEIGDRCYSEYLEAVEGLQVSMILVMDDIEHLTAINSPFAGLAISIEPRPGIMNCFHNKFSDAVGHPVKTLRGKDKLWGYLTRNYIRTPCTGCPCWTS